MSDDSVRRSGNAADQASSDYRESHLTKGASYDSRLSTTPFDAYMTRWETHWLARFVRSAYPAGIPRYLDFACGTGRITATVSQFAREAVGVDISDSMLEVAKSKCPQVRFVNADLTRGPPTLGTFDVITSFRFLGNAQDALRAEALHTLAGMLNPSGHLIINSHRNPQSVAAVLHELTGGDSEMDLHYFKLKRQLAEHGLRIVFLRAIGFWMFRSRMLANVDADHAPALLERLFSWPVFAPFAPDLFLVAQSARKP